MKFCIVGNGAMGVAHLKAINAIPGMQVTALQSRTKEGTEKTAAEYKVPFATTDFQAAITRKGSDLTLVGISRMVKFCNEVADRLQKDGISIEVIDIRTTSPLDAATILESVKKTGRLVVVDEANPMCSVASEISSIVASDAFDYLDAPIKKVTAPHTPVPASPTLEALYLPTPDKIEVVVRDLLEH